MVEVQRGKKIPIHVCIRITATESGVSTLLVGSAVGRADLSNFRCGLVRRIAARIATAEINRNLADALRRIELAGRNLYAHGAADSVAETIIESGLIR